jgi:two-component system, cell cycle sensor histidine kinase and response regulator CckA
MVAGTSNSETILVVEDEPEVRDLVTNILQGEGFKVVAAQNGEEALRAAESNVGNIDLVLTDIVMPGMSGGELVQQLIALQPEMRVLYMSGYTKYTVFNPGVLESVNSFIWKPFAPKDLLRKVREVLNGLGETSQA